MAHRLIKNNELTLYGPVGGSFFSEAGFADTEVIEALSDLQGDVSVRLNSGGGSAVAGLAIYNALKARDDKVTIYIDGVAASAASVIAMAGDDIVMREGALMMIHNASGITAGTAKDHAKTIEALNRLDGQMAGIYARRAGTKPAETQAMMDDETWLTGEEAVAKGLATRTDNEAAAEATAFDYRVYARAPQHLVAMATAFTAKHTGTTKADRDGVSASSAAAAGQGNREMKFEDITLSGLRENRADLVKDIEAAATAGLEAKLAEARAAGAQAERDRIKGIEENTLPGHEALTASLKFDGKTSPAEAAMAILKAEKALGGKALTAMADDEAKLKGLRSEFKAANDGASDTKKAGDGLAGEAKWKAEYAADAKLQAEFPAEAHYIALKKAEASGNVRFKSVAPRAA